MRHRRPRAWAIVVLLAAITAGSGGLAGPVSAAPFRFNPMPWLGLAANIADLFGGQSAIDTVLGPSSLNAGTDGRLTILLVGSDFRPRLSGTGERTDSIMLMTINNSREISAVSLPRDVGNVPIAPGVVWKAKVNGLFKHFKQIYGTREVALDHVRQSLEYAFQIQIDYVAMVRFTGFERLVGNVGGVPVSVPYNIYDSGIVDDRSTKQHGAKFLQSISTLELGSNAPLCYTVGNPINWNATPNCTRALLYVRSRHGPGNNDWRRARRQQSFVFAAIKRVLSNGQSQLDSLRSSALSNSDDVYTTLPTSPSDVLDMYFKLAGSSMPNQAVLSPPKYASNVPGTSKQELRIDVVRALMHDWFGPLS